MAIDGKLLAQAKRKLADERARWEAEVDRRLPEVYAKSPRIEELDAQIRAVMADIVSIAQGPRSPASDPDTDMLLENVSRKIDNLYSERRSLLQKAGFREDYLDDVYMCSLCGDTGYTKSGMCDCLRKFYRAEQKASLSSLFKLGDETFDSFNLSYYDDTPARDTGISPRQHMREVYETCYDYAHKFNSKSMNLFFNGAPGLGKTFLSACIARVVSGKDCSVVYDMACSIFYRFEDLKFSKSDDLDETREEINRYLECDFLIIDDLGTEMTTAYTIEVLYTIINTRLITNKKTLINSNMTIDEMRLRYSEQILSRLEGEYQILTFYGDDIRKKKNYAD